MSSSAAPSNARRAVFGIFGRPATTSTNIDVEAQLPSPAVAAQSPSRAYDAVDDFFGASRSSRSPSPAISTIGTRDSRHDALRLPTPVDDDASDADALPSYEHATCVEPPAYTPVSDQPTLAMYLFKFGFLFPLFWVAGAFVLLSPLQAPEDWEAGKSAREREELLASMRRAEVKWATRCLVALIVLALAAAALVLGALFVLKRH